MTEHVEIDDSPTVYAVHYNTSIEDATKHFTDAGFNNVRSMVKQDPGCNCNNARKQVVAIAKRQGKKAFFQGGWDYSAGRCAIYEFTYDSYTGDLHDGTGDWEYMANWSGHK